MTPSFEHEGIILIPFAWTLEKLEQLAEWLNDYKVVRFSEQRHLTHTRDTELVYARSFDRDASHLWEINNGAFIGTISAYLDRRNRVANVGIMIGDKSVWGKGIGSIAWKLVTDWIIDGGYKAEAGCMAENKGMLGIFAKTGMEIEGTVKNHFIFEDKPMDMILAGRIK